MALVKIYKVKIHKTCKCGNWLKHWENFSNQWIIWCSEINCKRIANTGALVTNPIKEDFQIYTIPLCRKHSRSTKILDTGVAEPVNIFNINCHRMIYNSKVNLS